MSADSDTRKIDEPKEKEKSPEPSEKGKKRAIEEVTGSEKEQVHSANDWEHAKLGGDEERRQKFLRLMGGKKKDHQGKIIIGDQKIEHQHGRSETDNKDMEDKLEAEFQHGLDHKLSGNARRHVGLGFSNEKPSEPVSSSEEPSNGDKPTVAEPSSEGNQSEPDSTSDTPHAPAADEITSNKSGLGMNFVKSSS